MTTHAAQQVALDDALVPLEKRVKIGKCNMRIDPAKTQKEPTYQVVLDAFTLTTYYLAFLITADVLEIYMHQFWFTINKNGSTSYRFKIDKKSYRINMEVFREILHICLKLLNQDVDELPSDGELSSSLRNLATKETLNLSLKFIAQILLGMFYKKNFDFVELLWKDFTFQIKNRDHKKQEKMYYPRFTKAIIHHFITKDKLISMRNKTFMDTARDDIILGTMRFVYKSKDFQVYGELLPSRMTNRQTRESNAYKTYLAYATGAASLKKKKKLKKPASPSKKRTLITVEEEEPEPAKKAISSKNHEAQLKKALKRSKREITIHQAGGSSKGADSKLEVFYEPKGKSIDTSKGTGLEPRFPMYPRTDFENQETNHDEEETKDEFIHTPPNYVPTDDETNDKSNEHDDKDKGNKEMTNAETKDVEHENVIQESAATTKATTSTTVVLDSETLIALHQRIVNLEKDVKELKDVDNTLKVISTIQYEVLKVVKEYLESSLDDDIQEIKMENAKKQQVPKVTITSFDTTALTEFDQKTTLFEIMSKSKSFTKIPKQRALYHALMKSILEDGDAMDEGVADKLKKQKPDDADKDEGPSAGSDRGLKRLKTSKDTEPSKKAKLKETSKGTSKGPQNLREDTGNIDEPPVVNVNLKDWFKKAEIPPNLKPKWNKRKSVENKLTQKWLSDLAKA
nr:hypothetical protein [Tanacetum cinerariifolium]